ncbi:MAG: transposase [Terriglobia bacterium]
MTNVHRLQNTDRIFFVTTNLRREIEPFGDNEFRLLVTAVEESRRRLGFKWCGYVFMPDHWHALIWPVYPITVSQAVQNIKYSCTRKVNRFRHTSGSLWQHQFVDRFVRHLAEFRQRQEYMHFNPVRKALVNHPGMWAWSSYNNYLLESTAIAVCPIQIDYVDLPYNYRA